MGVVNGHIYLFAISEMKYRNTGNVNWFAIFLVLLTIGVIIYTIITGGIETCCFHNPKIHIPCDCECHTDSTD